MLKHTSAALAAGALVAAGAVAAAPSPAQAAPTAAAPLVGPVMHCYVRNIGPTVDGKPLHATVQRRSKAHDYLVVGGDKKGAGRIYYFDGGKTAFHVRPSRTNRGGWYVGYTQPKKTRNRILFKTGISRREKVDLVDMKWQMWDTTKRPHRYMRTLNCTVRM